jgi:hypothetical protein
MRKIWIGAVAVLASTALAVGAAGAAGKAHPAGEATASANCGGGLVCVFTEGYFFGAEGQTVCGAEGAHPFGGWKHSVLNHCANRPVWVRINGSAKACMPAGGQIENFEFNEIWVGALGGHCN